MKTIAPNIAIPIVKPIAFATLKTRERKSESGRIGSAARRLPPDEHDEQGDAGDAEPDDRRRAPGVLVAAPGREQDQRADAAAEQRRRRARRSGAGSCGVCRCSRVTTIRTASAPIGRFT